MGGARRGTRGDGEYTRAVATAERLDELCFSSGSCARAEILGMDAKPAMEKATERGDEPPRQQERAGLSWSASRTNHTASRKRPVMQMYPATDVLGSLHVCVAAAAEPKFISATEPKIGTD